MGVERVLTIPTEGVRIVWLEEVSKFTYVRESVYPTTRRRGKITHIDGSDFAKIVAYEEHPKKAHGIQVYNRRVWWLKKHDWDICHGKPLGEIYPREEGQGRENRYTPKFGFAPAEAVFPGSISTDKESRPFSWKEWQQRQAKEAEGK